MNRRKTNYRDQMKETYFIYFFMTFYFLFNIILLKIIKYINVKDLKIVFYHLFLCFIASHIYF